MSLVLRLPNILRQKADKPGGRTPAEAIARAQAALAKLRASYGRSLRSAVTRLRADTDSLLADPDANKEAVTRIYTLAHDLRGQAATFDLPVVTEIGNSLCRYIESSPGIDSRDALVVELHVDAMRAAVAENGSGDGAVEREVLAGLDTVSKSEHKPRG